MKTIIGLLIAGCASAIGGQGVETFRLEPASNMMRAELHYVKTVPAPQAVLVLCPGFNGSGEELVRSARWREFARKNDLGLVGLSFASPQDAIDDGSGYYYASKGSGDKLLEGVRKIYGKDLPLLLYGFSGGAHFTSRFEEWNPRRVLAWCTYSAQWWDKPQTNSHSPAGIVACGEDDIRLGTSLIYFKQGRASGKPWLWVCLSKIGHNGSRQLDEFVRNYFLTILSRSQKTPAWVDIDRKTIVSDMEAQSYPSLAAWLPSGELFELWREIHEP